MRSGCRTVQAFLNALEGLEADQRLVLSLAQRHAPVGHFDISGVNRIAQQDRNALIAHDPFSIFGKQGLVLQETHDLCLVLEPPRSITFKRFTNDRRGGLVPYQNAPTPTRACKSEADWCLKRPVAIQYAGAHAVQGLLGVLLALVLREGRHHVFDHAGIRIVLEFHARAHQLAARFAQKIAQVPMAANVTRNSADVVNKDDIFDTTMLSHEFEHRVEAGSVNTAAGHVVAEHRHNLHIHLRREFPATRLLGIQAVATIARFGVGHSKIKNHKRGLVFDHGALSFPD